MGGGLQLWKHKQFVEEQHALHDAEAKEAVRNSGSSWDTFALKIQIISECIYWWKAKSQKFGYELKPKQGGIGLSLNFPPSAFHFGNKSSQMMCHLLCSQWGAPMPLVSHQKLLKSPVVGEINGAYG